MSGSVVSVFARLTFFYDKGACLSRYGLRDMGGVDPAYVVPRCKDSGRRKNDTYLLHYDTFAYLQVANGKVSHIKFRCLISRMVPNMTIT